MLYTYDPKSIVVTFKGHPITDFADDSFLTITRQEDMFTEKFGRGGSVTRSKSNNKSGTATLTLTQTGADNDFLSRCAILDENGNAGVGEFAVKDILGTTYAFSAQAYVKKMPDIALGKESGTRQWVLFCTELQITVGGNAPQI